MKSGTILLFKGISCQRCTCHLASTTQNSTKHYHIDNFRSFENFKTIFLQTKFYSYPTGDYTCFSLFYVPKINNIAIRCSTANNFLDDAEYKVVYEPK